MNEKKHAHLGDLPAWSAPLTVREIAEIKDSWGMALVHSPTALGATLVHDERGLLWVDATVKPTVSFITGAGMSTEQVLIFHYEGGIAIYLPKLAYKDLRMISDKSLTTANSGEQLRYIPVNHVASIDEIPDEVYADDPTTRRLLAERRKSKATLAGREIPGEA